MFPMQRLRNFRKFVAVANICKLRGKTVQINCVQIYKQLIHTKECRLTDMQKLGFLPFFTFFDHHQKIHRDSNSCWS